jgi:hypothetical protein
VAADLGQRITLPGQPRGGTADGRRLAGDLLQKTVRKLS